MFKFVSKGDNRINESALFYNGQKLFTVYSGFTLEDGGIMIQVEDGSGRLMKEWEDYLEDVD